MGSKPLNQKVAIALGVRSNGKEFTKKDIVEAVDATARDVDFDITELMWARHTIIEKVVTQQMKATLPDHVLAKLRNRVPTDLIPILEGMSAWICLGKGRKAPWVYAFSASPEAFLTSYELKHEISQHTEGSARRDLDAGNFLLSRGASSFEALCLGEAAA